jgi:uncharacterized protein YbjQ (UPF0145 family)
VELLIKLGIFLLLAVLGYWRGSRNERQHLKWLAEQERQLAGVLVFATRYPPPHPGPVLDPVLVSGSVVVGSDFFRLMIGALRKIIGGNYRSYEKLMDRGRRHALVNLKTQARECGARMVFNVRYVSAGIANTRANEAAQIEVLAYGTAYVPAAGSVAQSRVHHQPGTHITEYDRGQMDLMKNPASRWWVIGWFAGVTYCFAELLTDALWSHAWRYIGGAPWYLFGALALLITLGLVHNGRKHKLGWGENIILAVLTAPLLAFMLYFAPLRINGNTAFNAAPVRYELQSDFSLRPVAPHSGYPILTLDDNRDYWRTQKPGTQVDIVIARGWLGFAQYDRSSLSERYRAYYRSR